MKSFEDVRKYLAEKYKLISNKPDNVCISHAFEEDRIQNVYVYPHSDSFGDQYLKFKTLVGPAAKASAVRCLQLNAQLSCGYLAIERLQGEDSLIMCQSQLLDTLDADEIENALLHLAHVSEELQAQIIA